MHARETDTGQCPRIFTRNIHQQYRTTDSRHHTGTHRARQFKPQLCPPRPRPRALVYLFPPSARIPLPTEPWPAAPPLRPDPIPSPGRGGMHAHHLVAAPVEGVSLPEPAAVAAHEAHAAVAVGEVGPPHQGAVPENPQRRGVASAPRGLRGRRGGRGGRGALGCGRLLHGAGHRAGPASSGQVSGAGGRGGTGGRAHLAGTVRSLQPRSPATAPFKPSGGRAPPPAASCRGDWGGANPLCGQ